MTEEFEKFADQVTDELADRLLEEGYNHVTIGVRTVETVGGSYEAVNVKRTGSEIAISANLSKAYETYMSGIPLDEIAENMAYQIGSALNQLSLLDSDSISAACDFLWIQRESQNA